MISIPQIRSSNNQIVVLGNHESIIQSILDFDYLSGKSEGSIIAIVTGRRGYSKFFFGRREILIPTLVSLRGSDLKGSAQPRHKPSRGRSDPMGTRNLWLLNLLSGRRTLSSTQEFLTVFPDAAGAALFAENVPELHSLQLISANSLESSISHLESKLIVGPASVGLLVPGILKLGPIGGITPDQILEGKIIEPGSIAVLSASGGMTNELINIATQSGHRLSFAFSFGGDRFPVLSPSEAFLLAEKDPATKIVLYYGELGGEDEYELVKLKEEGKFTKKVVAHIAGTVASLFPESPQFGHAKARADKERVTATSKRAALASAGFQVSQSFSQFIKMVESLR